MRTKFLPYCLPLIGEEEIAEVVDSLRSGWVTTGPKVKRFEEEWAAYAGARHAIAVSSCTAALHASLAALDVGPGDEVIVPTLTFCATANVVVHLGATPVIVDVDQDFYMRADAVARAMSARTKAIVPVHYGGQACPLQEILALADRHGIPVVEDAAHAAGAEYEGARIGSHGRAVCFSFYAIKNMTTGEGGMVTTDDPEIAARARLYRSHGQRERYVHVSLGDNLRLTDFQGALGLSQLERLPALNEQRRKNAAYLTSRLQGAVATPVVQPGYEHVYHQYTIRTRGDRDQWANTLKERGIATGVHYPIPIHQQPFFVEQGYGASLPVAEQAAREVLSLPVHPALSEADLAKVADEVLALCK